LLAPFASAAGVPELELLAQACAYPLQAGGKRFRPMLLLSVAGALGGDQAVEDALPAAAAVELVHTYSLVHDDLPCMDDDDLRRGQPTTHRVFGEAQGLLVGDALLTEAFAELSALRPGELAAACVRVLARAAGVGRLAGGPRTETPRLVPQLGQQLGLQLGMVAGQWLDLSAPPPGAAGPAEAQELLWERLEGIHRAKTGALIGAAFELGARIGVARPFSDRPAGAGSGGEPSEPEEWFAESFELGSLLGLAFQLVDDVLDETRTSAELGKTPGKDRAQGKLTGVRVLGLEGCRQRAHALGEEALRSLELWLARAPRRAGAPSAALESELQRWKNELHAGVRAILRRES
jgi:geranylgeranyl diphosphate synthase type II